MNESKYLILCLNTAHPTKEHAFFLLDDEDDNTVVFDSREDAVKWIKENRNWNAPILYTIICTSDFYYFS